MVTITKIDFVKVLATTALVFLVGLALGYTLDTSRVNYLAEELRTANIETESFITAQLYLEETSGQSYCRLVKDRISQISRQTTQLGNDLKAFGGSGMFREQDYKLLQRRYYLYQTRFMLLLENYRERCNAEFLSIIFLFGDNVASQRQGSVLTEFRQQNQGEVFVFSFALPSDIPISNMIANTYNVTTTPTIVVNQNRTLRGFTSKGELEALLRQEVNDDGDRTR